MSHDSLTENTLRINLSWPTKLYQTYALNLLFQIKSAESRTKQIWINVELI